MQITTGKEASVLKAVAFDLDDTLLSLNLGAFIAVLAKDYATLLGDIARKNPLAMLAAVGGAMLELNGDDRPESDERSNLTCYQDAIERRSGVPLGDPVIAEAFTCYEREVLPARNDRIIAARPAEGAREAISCVIDRGLRLALLTNPCFTRACVECRMDWADVRDVPFELVTSMENTRRCKPSATYYLDACFELGVEPGELLMVGNDPKRDFPSPDCGIQTAYVGTGAPVRATWSGSMADFAASFDEICERFDERTERGLVDLVQDVDARSHRQANV